MSKSLSEAINGDEVLLWDPDLCTHLVAYYWAQDYWQSDSWSRLQTPDEVESGYEIVQWLSTLDERRAMMEENYGA